MATEAKPTLDEHGTAANAEAIEAWDGPLYDRFVRFRHLLTAADAATIGRARA